MIELVGARGVPGTLTYELNMLLMREEGLTSFESEAELPFPRLSACAWFQDLVRGLSLP